MPDNTSENNKKKKKTILVLGGYGNAGRLITELLLQESATSILIVAGRNLDRATSFVSELEQKSSAYTERLQPAQVDASSLSSIQSAFQSIDMVVVASSTTAYTENILQAASDAKIDYFDIQVRTSQC